jgi:hypothetical protein
MTKQELQERVEQLEKALQDALEAPMKMTWEMCAQHVEGQVEHWAVRLVCCSFAKTLADSKNFITLTMVHPEQGKFDIVIQRVGPGKQTTNEALHELRNRIRELEHGREYCDSVDGSHI